MFTENRKLVKIIHHIKKTTWVSKHPDNLERKIGKLEN